MVLVDTSPAGEGLIDENQRDFDEAEGRGREGYVARMLHCAYLWEQGAFESSGSELLDRSYGKIWNAMHADLARLSSRGVHRVIKQSGHEIQLDQPQAVIDAVNEVLGQLHAGAKS
jgi:hypothetical protein